MIEWELGNGKENKMKEAEMDGLHGVSMVLDTLSISHLSHLTIPVRQLPITKLRMILDSPQYLIICCLLVGDTDLFLGGRYPTGSPAGCLLIPHTTN